MAPSAAVTVVALSLLAISGAIIGYIVHEEHKEMDSTSDEEVYMWTYGEDAGDDGAPYAPEDWGVMYEDCNGHSQSPINLSPGYEVVTPREDFNLNLYPDICSSEELLFEAGDHSWKIDISGCEDKPKLSFKNDTYQLVNIHWHSVSEHTSGWACHDAEMHMVHTNEDDDSQLLVVGTLMDASSYADNILLSYLWDVFLTKEETWEGDEFDVGFYELLPADPSYSHYNGSLTTPPCTEGVQWIVMSQPTLMSERQLDMFRHSMMPYHRTSEYGHTNRPVQMLHGRTVYYVG